MFSIHDSCENIFNVYSEVNIVQLTTFKQTEHERDILCSLMTSSMQPVTTTYRYMAETALFGQLSVCSISTGNAAVLRDSGPPRCQRNALYRIMSCRVSRYPPYAHQQDRRPPSNGGRCSCTLTGGSPPA